VTAAALALAALAEAQAEGVTLDDVVERDPVVLALSPPRIGGGLAPAAPVTGPTTIDLRDGAPSIVPPPAPVATSDAAVVREGLRLRARWVQELTARAAAELGQRLESVGVLPHRAAVRRLELAELRIAVRTRAIPADIGDRVDPATAPPRTLPAPPRVPGQPPARPDVSSRSLPV